MKTHDWTLLRMPEWIHEWTLFYNSGRTEERPPPRTVRLLLCFSRCYETSVNLVATLWFLQVYSLLRNALLASRCIAMDYSVSILCRGNVLTEPLSSNGHIRHNIPYNCLIYCLLKPHSNLSDIFTLVLSCVLLTRPNKSNAIHSVQKLQTE
jgi:hypothetical protein